MDRLGQLESLAVPAKKDTDLCVVLLHGYGADASDLAPLANNLDPKQQAAWFFLQGPLEVPVGPMWTGRAWFPINVQELEAAMAQGRFRELVDWEAPGFEEARDKVLNSLQILNKTYGKVVLGGFSQGAMLSTEVALQHANQLEGLLLFSSNLIRRPHWRALAPRAAGLKYFQSHGRRDPILPFAGAERLHEMLLEAGLEGSFQGFNGGHEIPFSVLSSLKEFLAPLLEA
jgi:phospholipase/carboxylesterase